MNNKISTLLMSDGLMRNSVSVILAKCDLSSISATVGKSQYITSMIEAN